MAGPVTLQLAKAHLRVTSVAEDALLQTYIDAAHEWVEDYTGLVLTRRTVVEELNTFSSHVNLRAWPIVSVDAVSYADAAGVEQSLEAANYYAVAARRPARIVPASIAGWPRAGVRMGSVKVTMTAGYATPEDVPKTVVRAILLLVAHSNVHREPVAVGAAATEIPLGVEALLRKHRVRRL